MISHRDILNQKAIEFTVKDFTLYAKPLEDRNYPDELIEELASALNQKNTIPEKIEVLRSYLDGVIELPKNITLAFSEENPFTSQLLSELKTIQRDDLASPSSFLDKFLTQKEIPNQLPQIESSEFIQITGLNADQKTAVRLAFNQPLTVVTGPPGTGKTQVVLNILANAVLQNKSVLFASKNNQAIDNVKERLSTLIKEPDFFLRFGSKAEVREKIKPIILSYVTRIHNNLLKDNSEALTRVLTRAKGKKTIIATSLAQLEKLKMLENNIPNIQLNIKNVEQEFQRWIKTNDIEAISIFDKYSKESLRIIISKNKTITNEIVSKYSGFGKFFFNLTSKMKYAVSLASYFETWSPKLKGLAEKQGIHVNLNCLNSYEIIISTYSRLTRFIESGILLKEKKTGFEKTIEEMKSQLREDQNEARSIKANETKLQNEIPNNQQDLDNMGIDILNELIHNKIRAGSKVELNKFKDYIPDNIPRNSQEISEFVKTTKSFLETFNICAITSLSVKSAFPLVDNLFDLVVIDEASQCDIASAIPLVLRAKRLVVIGDRLQLKHITKVQSYEEKYILTTLGIDGKQCLDYVNQSLYDYCFNLSLKNSDSHGVFLNEHFRCHPDIINYSNKAFYKPMMGQELDVLTRPDDFRIEPKGIYWINTMGNYHPQRNVNRAEIERAVELARSLAEEHIGISIGIATPFNHQAREINNAIPTNFKDRIKADTVFRFQGDEKDIMILSLVVCEHCPPSKAKWINNQVPYLINVAVTRARNTLYIVGDADYCRTLPDNSPLGLLVKYIDDLRQEEVNDERNAE